MSEVDWAKFYKFKSQDVLLEIPLRYCFIRKITTGSTVSKTEGPNELVQKRADYIYCLFYQNITHSIHVFSMNNVDKTAF